MLGCARLHQARRRIARSVAISACLLAASTAAGCGGGASSTGSGAATLGAAKATESIGEAQKRIDDALASKDCKRINDLNPLGRPGLSSAQRCAYLSQLAGLTPVGAEEYGDAGAVIDYKQGDRTIDAVLIRDADGRYRIAFINPFNGRKTVGTPYAHQFDAAAHESLKALEGRDCSAYIRVVFRRFARGSTDEQQICAFVDQNPTAKLLETQPDFAFDRAGGSAYYGFYTLGTPSSNSTMILAREQNEGAPAGTPKLPPGAAEYAYVGIYRTNDTPGSG